MHRRTGVGWAVLLHGEAQCVYFIQLNRISHVAEQEDGAHGGQLTRKQAQLTSPGAVTKGALCPLETSRRRKYGSPFLYIVNT